MRRVKLVLIKPVYRVWNRNGKEVVREFDYELKGDVVEGVYNYAKMIRERYGYITKIEIVRSGKRTLIRFVDNRDNAVPLYVDVETGYVYVPEAYIKKFGKKFAHVVVSYFVGNSGIYNVRSRVVSNL